MILKIEIAVGLECAERDRDIVVEVLNGFGWIEIWALGLTNGSGSADVGLIVMINGSLHSVTELWHCGFIKCQWSAD